MVANAHRPTSAPAPGSAAPGNAAPGSAAPGSAAPGSAARGSAARGSAARGSGPADVDRLIRDVERLRYAIVRDGVNMAEDVERAIRTADRLLTRTAGSQQEQRVRSSRTLLHCLHCGLKAA